MKIEKSNPLAHTLVKTRHKRNNRPFSFSDRNFLPSSIDLTFFRVRPSKSAVTARDNNRPNNYRTTTEHYGKKQSQTKTATRRIERSPQQTEATNRKKQSQMNGSHKKD